MIPIIVIVAFLVGLVVGLVVMAISYEIYNYLHQHTNQ